MQKSGNNNLFLVVGLMIIVLLGLIFIGSLRESSVEQLIEGAGPDSSSFVEATPGEVFASNQSESVETIKETPVSKPLAEKNIPDSSQQATGSDSKKETTPIKVQESGGEKIYFYTIKRGDTMYKIAAKFGNKPDDILALNGLSDMNLQADKEIKVKIKALHPVASGEGLNAVAEKYQVPVKSIQVANGLSADVLSEGMELIIPLK